MQLSAASDCSHILGKALNCYRTLLKFRDDVYLVVFAIRRDPVAVELEGWFIYFCHFRVIAVRLHAGKVLLLPYQVGVGSNVASGHLLLVPCFCVLFISPSHSRCFSMGLWHHTLVNHNQMLFPGQHDMFRQMHTRSCTHSHSNTSLHSFVKNENFNMRATFAWELCGKVSSPATDSFFCCFLWLNRALLCPSVGISTSADQIVSAC